MLESLRLSGEVAVDDRRRGSARARDVFEACDEDEEDDAVDDATLNRACGR